MEMNILDLSESTHEKKFVWLIAMSIFNVIMTFSLFVLLIGLIFSSSAIMIVSAVLFGTGIGFSLFIYKRNVTKISISSEQIMPSIEPIETVGPIEEIIEPKPIKEFKKEEKKLLS